MVFNMVDDYKEKLDLMCESAKKARKDCIMCEIMAEAAYLESQKATDYMEDTEEAIKELKECGYPEETLELLDMSETESIDLGSFAKYI